MINHEPSRSNRTNEKTVSLSMPTADQVIELLDPQARSVFIARELQAADALFAEKKPLQALDRWEPIVRYGWCNRSLPENCRFELLTTVLNIALSAEAPARATDLCVGIIHQNARRIAERMTLDNLIQHERLYRLLIQIAEHTGQFRMVAEMLLVETATTASPLDPYSATLTKLYAMLLLASVQKGDRSLIDNPPEMPGPVATSQPD